MSFSGDPGHQYVERRVNADGTERFYWRRRPYPVRRLPDSPVERYASAYRWNSEAKDGQISDGTVAWCAERYLASDRHTRLKPKTKANYKRNLDRLVDAWGHLSVAEITTGRVLRFTETFGERYSSRDDALTVLRLIMETARRYELIIHNPCSRLGLSKPPPRQAYWRDADIEAFLKVCRDPRIALAFKLALYTGQRAGDVLAFRWGQYDGQQIASIRQQKTGALLNIPVHIELRAALDGYRAALPVAPHPAMTMLAGRTGKPLPYTTLSWGIRDTANRAGLDGLWLHDLRRTCVVKLAEAGCSTAEIGAITGHSDQSVHRMMRTYLPKTFAMARNAITKLEKNR